MNPRPANYTNWQLIKDLKSFIAPYKGKFWAGTFLRISSDIAWLYPIWALSQIITFATEYERGDSLLPFWQSMALIGLAAFYHYIVREWAKYYLYQVAEKISIDARLSTLAHIFRLNAQWHEKENTGNKMRRIDRGGEGMNELVRMYVDLVIESIINLIAISAIFYSLSWQHSAILSFFFVTYFILSVILTKKTQKFTHIANVEWERFSGRAFESVNNISTVKALNIGPRLNLYLKELGKTLREKIFNRIKAYRLRGALLNLYQEFFRQMLVLYTVLEVLNGKFQVGIIAAVLLYFGKLRESVGELAEVANEFAIHKITIMRMREILSEVPTVELLGKKRFESNWKRLEMRNIRFSYRGNKILKDFSLSIARGEKIGIVGLSGAGKSTLFKLLLKLYTDYEGDILFDGISLNDIKRSSFMKNVAIVPQDTELFNLSLRENITLEEALGKAHKERLEAALKVAHVADFVHKLEQGIESRVGEKGIKLSGGERQRVGIARAVYRQPQILLLDEATSHLDVESEKKIQEALHEFLKKTTAIVIAHRLSTIREMDRIVVMKSGAVAEQGSFDELMDQKGIFYQLWQRQKF